MRRVVGCGWRIWKLLVTRENTRPDPRCWDHLFWGFYWLSRPEGWRLPFPIDWSVE